MSSFHSDRLPGRTLITQQGTEYLWFGGTDYLGMAHNQAYVQWLTEGIGYYGTHYGSSRNGPVQPLIYAEAEHALARFASAPSALTVSSGMWAGQLIARSLPDLLAGYYGDDSLCLANYFAPRTHPALRSVKPDGDEGNWADWAVATVTAIQNDQSGLIHVIYADSIGSPWVESFDFSVFDKIDRDKQVWMIVDDSHGIGVLGQSGQGCYLELSQMPGIRLLVTASLNKAMGIPGGVIFSEEKIIQLIRNSPWFSGASPIAPANLFAMTRLLASGTYDLAFARLRQRLVFFTSVFQRTQDFAGLPGYPVFCKKAPELHHRLLKENILVPCFPYPNPHDEPVLRLVINALHDEDDLEKLALLLNRLA